MTLSDYMRVFMPLAWQYLVILKTLSSEVVLITWQHEKFNNFYIAELASFSGQS